LFIKSVKMKKTKVVLTAADKDYLKSYVSKGSHAARAIGRARMLLMLQEGVKNQKQIAHDCNCSEGTVTNLLKRYHQCKGRIKEVLEEKPRSGQPTILTPELEANITALACCSEGPDGRSSWTLELIADKMVKDKLAVHLSYETVRKVLKKASLNPGLKSSGASLK
jgi:putative transposase